MLTQGGVIIPVGESGLDHTLSNYISVTVAAIVVKANVLQVYAIGVV